MTTRNLSLLFPIYNLRISDDIGGELRIERVTFLSAGKLPRIRRRLGLAETVAAYRDRFRGTSRENMLSGVDAYAHIRTQKENGDEFNSEFRRIRDAVYLLASSQLYRERRGRFAFGPPEHGMILWDQFYAFGVKQDSWQWHRFRLGPAEPYVIDKQWLGFLKQHFFLRLIKILNGQTKVKSDWRKKIRAAAICAGRSYLAKCKEEALLYDMIGIEILLAHPQEKFRETVSDRLWALFGWYTKEDPTAWKDSVNRLYDLRCKFVHEGHSENVTGHDVLLGDQLLANVLGNVCKLSPRLSSKMDIVALSERTRASRTLGRKPVRPRTLSFARKFLTERQLADIDTERHWNWWM